MNKQPSIKPGLTIAEVGEILGLEYQAARKWAINNGYRYRRFTFTGLDPDQTIKFLNDHADSTLAQAAELLGVTRQRAHQLYRQYGIKRTKRAMTSHWDGNISNQDENKKDLKKISGQSQ